MRDIKAELARVRQQIVADQRSGAKRDEAALEKEAQWFKERTQCQKN